MTVDAALSATIAPQEFPFTVTALQNPVTRFDVQVVPPVEVTSAEQWGCISAKFTAYCKAAWVEGPNIGGFGPVRLSPESIGADWLTLVPPSAAPAAPASPAAR